MYVCMYVFIYVYVKIYTYIYDYTSVSLYASIWTPSAQGPRTACMVRAYWLEIF